MQLPILPSQVTQKRQDGPVQGALDNISAPLNVVLQWLRSVFTYAGGLLTATFDNLVVNVKATIAQLVVTTLQAVSLLVTGNATINGSFTVLGSSILQAISGTTATFSGTATANSVVSAQGFKSSTAGTYSYASTTLIPNTDTAMSASFYPPSGGAYPNYVLDGPTYGWVAPFAGSVLAVSGGGLRNAVAKTITFTVYKNGAATALATTAASGTGTFKTFNTSAKGVVSFAAGDMLEVRIRSNSATAGGAEGGVAYITVEMGA